MSKTKTKRNFKTSSVGDIIKHQSYIGDKLANISEEVQDLKVISLAIQAYSGAVNAAKAQMIYKKQTGKPGKIKFFE